jgi:tetratricopeptide (TPR) repeat protein
MLWLPAPATVAGQTAGAGRSGGLLGGRAAADSSARAARDPADTRERGTDTRGWPGDPRERIALANRYYQEERFADAARLYDSVLEEGRESPALYLNLGNALIRSGELGEAIVAYRRGLRLAPRDRDLLANLAFAQARTIDVVPEESTSVFLEGLAGLLRRVSAREALIAAASIYWLVVVVFVAGRLLPERRRLAGAVLWVLVPLLALAAGLAAERAHATWGRHEAVVLTDTLVVRNGPGDDYAVRFELHEGTTVSVRRRALDWLEVELTEELSGWVPADDVAPI